MRLQEEVNAKGRKGRCMLGEGRLCQGQGTWAGQEGKREEGREGKEWRVGGGRGKGERCVTGGYVIRIRGKLGGREGKRKGKREEGERGERKGRARGKREQVRKEGSR